MVYEDMWRIDISFQYLIQFGNELKYGIPNCFSSESAEVCRFFDSNKVTERNIEQANCFLRNIKFYIENITFLLLGIQSMPL